MPENETAEQAEINYDIKVEDAGPGAKKVTVEIPREAIDQKIEEQYKEVRSEAQIPGFRKGHVPQKLIEKRFGADIKNEVRRDLISDSYQKAVEKHSLNVVGEPEFDNPDAIKLPEEGALSYSFQVEVQPEITLPELTGIPVKKPKIDVTEAHVDQAMTNLREQQGAVLPVEDRGVEAKDMLTADVHLKLDGVDIAHQHDAQVVARGGRIAGLQVDDFDKQVEGMKPGEKRSIKATAPEDHPNEAARGKEVEIEVALKEIKRVVPAEINQEFLDDLGFEGEKELREALREQMVMRIENDVKRSVHSQVVKHLLSKVEVTAPAKLSERQRQRVVNRRATDLMSRGVSQDVLQANIEKLQSGAAEEATEELKAFFVLSKLAEQLQVEVTEAELNGRVALIAIQQGQRPERLRQEMQKNGQLQNLYVAMREEKAIDKVLESAKIEEADAPEAAKAGEEPAAT